MRQFSRILAESKLQLRTREFTVTMYIVTNISIGMGSWRTSFEVLAGKDSFRQFSSSFPECDGDKGVYSTGFQKENCSLFSGCGLAAPLERLKNAPVYKH